MTLARYGLAIPSWCRQRLILHSSGDLSATVVLLRSSPSCCGGCAVRATSSGHRRLCYEEAPEPAVIALDLQPTGEMRTPATAAANQPVVELFSAALVESRRAAETWAEEIREERRHLSGCLKPAGGCPLRPSPDRRDPLFSAVVALTLTVGIGINTSIFTVVNGLALRHVSITIRTFSGDSQTAFQFSTRRASYAEYAILRDQNRSLAQLAAWGHFPAFVGQDNSAGSVGMAISCNFFLVEGLDRPLLGRLFTAGDCRANHEPVAIISEPLWRARFGSDPSITGRVVG
jgi:hypothetical protein